MLSFFSAHRAGLAALAAAVGISLVWAWAFGTTRIKHAEQVAALEAQLAAARGAEQVAAAVVMEVERVGVRERTIVQEVKGATREINAAVGADALVPPAVVERWAGALQRLREQEPAGAGGDDQTAPIAP